MGNDNKPVCPKCGSDKIQPVGRQKKGFSTGKALAGGLMSGGVGLLAGFSGKEGKLEFYCSNCGHVFKNPSKQKKFTEKKEKKEEKAKSQKNITPFYHQKWFWIIVAVIVVFACIYTYGDNNKDKSNQDNGDQTQVEKPQEKESEKNDNSDYMNALRKCTVMEAADIYTTGIGGNPATSFQDALKTCEETSSRTEEAFMSLMETAWEERKDETLEGHKLGYYLDKLGW